MAERFERLSEKTVHACERLANSPEFKKAVLVAREMQQQSKLSGVLRVASSANVLSDVLAKRAHVLDRAGSQYGGFRETAEVLRKCRGQDIVVEYVHQACDRGAPFWAIVWLGGHPVATFWKRHGSEDGADGDAGSGG